jgi:hypothetical protein
MRSRSIMRHSFLSALCATITLMSCSDLGTGPGAPPDTSDQITITQGIWGNVWFWEGDFMPGPGARSGKITPVERDLWIYAATKHDSVVGAGYVFFRQVLTELKARTRSNKSGFYQVALPPGKYSVFVMEDSLFYANGSDGAGHIMPGVVTAQSVTKVQVDVTYKAAY